MAGDKRPKLGRFWLKLAVAYVLLIAVWPFVRPYYDRLLGELTGLLVPVFAVEEMIVRKVFVDDELHFHMTARSLTLRKACNVRYHIDPHQYGYGHIMFTALAIAVPGWVWRKRLIKWIVGTCILQGFFVLMVLLSLYCTVGLQGEEAWRGDWFTKIISPRWYLDQRDYIVLAAAQFVPILVWLALYVFPRSRMFFAPGPIKQAAKEGV